MKPTRINAEKSQSHRKNNRRSVKQALQFQLMMQITTLPRRNYEKKLVSQKEFEQLLIDLNAMSSDKKPKLINLGGNLYIYPRKSDSKMNFAVRLFIGKSDTRVIIGYYPNISLAEARIKAKMQLRKHKKP